MNRRQLPLLLLLAILCVGGVWFLTMDQEPIPIHDQEPSTWHLPPVESASMHEVHQPGNEREDVSPRLESEKASSVEFDSPGFALQLMQGDQTPISGWQLALIDLDDGTILKSNGPTDQLGIASFPIVEQGRYSLEGALLETAAFQMQLVIVGLEVMKVPLSLTSQTELQFQDAKTKTRLTNVECYLEGSHLLVAKSNAIGVMTLMTQTAQFRFEKNGYASSYVLDAGGESATVLLRPEIEVRVELAGEWREYPGTAKATLEKVLKPIADYAAYFTNQDPNPGPTPFDYLRYQQDFDFVTELSTTVMVPEGIGLTLRAQKGGAVVSMKTGELSAGQVIFVPAPVKNHALELYLRNPSGELVQGNLRVVEKGTDKAIFALWKGDHWVIPQPESCAHFEIKVKGCAEIWCWQKTGATNRGGFLELQLVQEHTFLGFREGSQDASPLPLRVALEPSEYEEGVQVHEGWISKTPGRFEITLRRSGVFEIEGLPEKRFSVLVKPAANARGFGKALGEVLLPQESPFMIPQESMNHYSIGCIDKASRESILEFAGSDQEISLSTEAQMGLWQGWAEEGDAFVFRATGYQPLEIVMPAQSAKQLELEMLASAPMTLKISGLSDDDLASYSSLSLNLMRKRGDDLVAMSFHREIALQGREIEACFPGDGEWVVLSLRKPNGVTLSPKSHAFLWEPGGAVEIEF